MNRAARPGTTRGTRWAVLISGRGSNLQALLDLGANLDVRLVASSKASAPGLLRARRHGVPTLVLPKKIDWAVLERELHARKITHIFLAGFMKLIPADFVNRWESRLLNVHPSLLPAYPGLAALEKSYEDDAAMGVTVHVVTPGMDEGPRLLQRQTLAPEARARGVTPAEAQWRTSLAEQRLVREAAERWR